MKLQKVYHMGIPVDNLDRAKDFYTKVLGMEYLGRVGGNPNNPDSFPIHGVAQKLDRFRCGSDDVVLFERPKPIQRDALDEDGIFHQAFDMAWEDYDDALKTAKRARPLSPQCRARQWQHHLHVRLRRKLFGAAFSPARRPETAASELMVIEESTSPRRTRRARSLEMKIIPTFVPFVPSW
jgi:catechol 2,3-dioxygenase-like lactoylglutathione lyase family enzyme